MSIIHPFWQDIIKSYFKTNGFVKHQLESYNEFVEVGIQKILNEIGPIEIKTSAESRGGEATYIITFGTISIKKPVIREHDGTTNILYPQEARNRNLTYHSSLYCDITVRTIKNSEETVKVSKEQLGYIPIMVRSKFCLLYGKTEKEAADLGECIYDEGGYFIVNGNEKAIIAQERMPNNIVYCFYKKPPSKIIWQAEIRSQFEYHIKTTSTFYIRIFSKGSRSSYTSTPTFTDIDGIRGQITYIRQDIPIIFIFYALGFTSKNDIIDIITNSRIPLDKSNEDEYFKNILKFLRCSFDEANEILQEESVTDGKDLIQSELQDFALDYIGKKGSTVHGSRAERIKYSTQIINRELLPHLSLNYEDIFQTELQLCKTKAHFVGYIINKLYLCYLGILKENDRDHLANKRLDLTGNLLTSLFKGIFKRLHKEAKVNLTKSIEANNSFDLMNNIKSKSITNDLKYALSTGNWGRQTGGTPPKTGVAQQLNRLTFSSSLSHLRRLNTPLNREGKQAKPRQLHNTHFGYLCPAETPEGQGCTAVNTSVLLANGDLIRIKDLEKTYRDKSIYTVDVDTRKLESTDIVAFQKHDTKKYSYKVLKITTMSGRSISLTSDHPFAVPGDTFIEAGQIKNGDKVLIHPTAINQLHDEVPIISVLDKEMYIDIITKSKLVSNKTIVKDIEKLEASGLLPFMNNDKRLPIIASLIGYCDTDGHITKCAKFSMGCKEDMEAIENAVYSLGYGTTSEGKEYKNIQILTNGRKINHTCWNISISSNLTRLLVALGAMVGKKITQESRVPDFLKYCNLRVKASYLSALFGGDGEALNYVENDSITRKSSRWIISPPGFGNTKIESLTENLEIYLNEIKILLLEFGIESRDTKNQTSIDHEKYNLDLEDEEKETKIKRRFYITSNYPNILKFVDNIGYKWCKQKQNKMQIVGEYIRYLQNYIDQTELKRQQAHKLYEFGMRPTEIAKQIGMPLKRVEHVFYSKKYASMAIPRDYVKWPDFLADTQANFDTGTLYDKVDKIEEVSIEECPVVMDLTTESENHTFVSGGFVTHNCGLLRNLAITCHVSIGSNKTFIILTRFLRKYTDKYFIECREMITDEILYKVFLDGAWVVSVTEKIVLFLVEKLKKFRRKLMISFDTSICLDKDSKEFHMFTSSGRCCRPLIITENLHVLDSFDKLNFPSWYELLAKGVIEYIDVAEEEEIMIAMDVKTLRENSNTVYTHMEIHPSLMLGICASIIPFPDHNQSPRNIYQSAMGKQAMGIYASNFNERFDTLAHVLHYPQKPLVTTTIMKYMRFEELPAGINAIVAIACYGGYNQEDSVIINKGFLDRGGFRSSFYRTYVDQEKEIVRVGGLMEQFEIPNRAETKGIQHGNYGKLGPDGIIEPGSRTIENDVIIGKTTPIATSKQEISQMKKFKKRDVSTSMRPNEVGVVDKVLLTTNSDGYKYTKVKMRSIRIPEVGDKFASATADHDILTLEGWKNITQITMEDEIATLKDNKLVYEKPTEVYHHLDYEGEMYEIRNTSIDLRVSGNHKMWVSKRYGRAGIWQSYEFERANTIVGVRRKYKKDAEWDAPDYFFTLPKCVKSSRKEMLVDLKFDTPEKMNAWLIILGLWIAEGWNGINRAEICHCKDRVAKALHENLPILGFDYTENINEFPFYKLYINNKQVADYLLQFSPDGVLTKFLPDWCFKLSREQTRTLLHGLMLGDGYISKSNAHAYYTSSDKLADQVQQLALHAGWSATITERSEGIKEFVIRGKICKGNHPGWVVSIIKTKLNPEINNGHTRQQNAQVEIFTKHVKEPVYCISVPSEVFYIRRNGKTVWTGNSRHGQKGTIGMIYRQEDMPFTVNGIVPDIIINPHAIPSRMTIGHLIECLLGKVCVLAGREGDSTPFTGLQESEIAEALEKYGYAGDGTEILYNGESGEPMEARIFIGPTYYQRLKHMVQDKEHCLELDHEVLTLTGWKFFNDITMEDKIACLKDNYLVYENPTALLYYPEFEGDLYHIKNEFIDLSITEDHRVYASLEIQDKEFWYLYKIKDIYDRPFLMKTMPNNDIYKHTQVVSSDISIIYTKCPVFCLEVPGEVFYVRRNGKSVWTGNSRSTGPVTKLTRQPLEGRSREGGLRFGEMERDALISHGATNMLKDRLFYNSDPYRVHVCKLCGTICQADLDKQRFLCKCIKGGNTTEVAQVFIPYACKLFFQELMAMSIVPRIKL